MIYINSHLSTFPNFYSNNLGGTDEYVTYGDSNSFTPAALSLTVLVKKASGTFAGFMGKLESATSFEYSLFMFGSQVFGRIYSQSNSGVFIGRGSTVTVPDGVWKRYTMTWSGGTTNASVKLYEDSTQIDTTNSSAGTFVSLSNTSAALRVGTFHTASGFLNGKVAHPALFNKELSASEVAELTAKKMGDYRTLSFGANLVVASRFPNGTSDYPTYSDYSGNGFNGTMTNQESGDIDTDIPT